MKSRAKRLVACCLIAFACLALCARAGAQETGQNANVTNANVNNANVSNANVSNANANQPATGGKPAGTGVGGGNSNNSNAPGGAQQPRIVHEPATVMVTGQRGDTEARRLLLQGSEPLALKQVVVNDLQRADGRVMPAGNIRSSFEGQAAAEFPHVDLGFDLSGVPAGEFTGNVRLVHAKGVHSVPVNVKVKHHWLPPLVVLLAGLALGAGLTAYRTKGRLRDAVLVRVGQLRAQVRTDADLNSDLARAFREQIENHLVDVQVALDAEKWADASTAADRAQTVFNVWARHRPSWLEQLRSHADLGAQLRELKKLTAGLPSAYLLKVERALDDAARDAASADAPKALRDRLDVIGQQMNDYVYVRSQIKEIERLTAALPATIPADVRKAWQATALSLAQRLDRLLPGDSAFAAAYQSLSTETNQKLAEVAKLIPPGDEVVSLDAALDLAKPPPAVRRTPDERRAAEADKRLRLFTRVSYAIALVLLAGIGFGELYVARPTFGATAWGDYFALLAWGFGAEATRASIAQTVRNWGLLGFPNS